MIYGSHILLIQPALKCSFCGIFQEKLRVRLQKCSIYRMNTLAGEIPLSKLLLPPLSLSVNCQRKASASQGTKFSHLWLTLFWKDLGVQESKLEIIEVVSLVQMADRIYQIYLFLMNAKIRDQISYKWSQVQTKAVHTSLFITQFIIA